ncbi:hypothetical protein J6590_099938, partial [Homalodisca vitripennis]
HRSVGRRGWWMEGGTGGEGGLSVNIRPINALQRKLVLTAKISTANTPPLVVLVLNTEASSVLFCH